MLPQIDLAVADKICVDEKQTLEQIEKLIAMTIAVANLKLVDNAELSILLAGDETLQSLNREWRNKDKSTNVLSFPGEDIAVGQVAGRVLGDIVISLETTRREATLENKPFDNHFSHLVVHGFLHLFGYDHETDEEASQMENLETRILNELGIADPYHDE